ncbi:MAG: glycoside hydrolase family protein [Acidobacteriia bacterium]|nr:glycoside hydrolase family protein [Terriglobia bacterium]
MSTTLICNQLRRDEGFRQFPYRDGRGVLTVGYGFNLESDGLSQTEAGTVLHLRVYTRYRELVAALPWVLKLDLVRQAVLVNMAYNMGVHGLLEFAVTLTNVQAGDYEAAADAMLKSTWADQVGARAQRLAVQMRTGEWQ